MVLVDAHFDQRVREGGNINFVLGKFLKLLNSLLERVSMRDQQQRDAQKDEEEGADEVLKNGEFERHRRRVEIGVL